MKQTLIALPIILVISIIATLVIKSLVGGLKPPDPDPILQTIEANQHILSDQLRRMQTNQIILYRIATNHHHWATNISLGSYE